MIKIFNQSKIVLGFSTVGKNDDICILNRDRVKPARTAPRQKSTAGPRDRHGLRAVGPRPRRRDAPVPHPQPGRRHPLKHLNRGRVAHLRDQCAHDLGPGLIAAHPHDAGKAVRGLARHDIAAIGLAVEGGAKPGQVKDVLARVLRDHLGHGRIHSPSPGAHRVAGMGGGGIDRIHGAATPCAQAELAPCPKLRAK